MWGTTVPHEPGRDGDAIVAAAAAGELAALVVGRRRPRRPARPGGRRGRARGGRLRGQPRGPRQRRLPAPPTWSSRSPRSPRRPACSWTGRAGSVPSRRCCATRTRCPTCGCWPASPTRWACDLGFRTVEEARAEMQELGAWDGDRARRCPRRSRGSRLAASTSRRRSTARCAGDLEAAARRRPDARRRRLPQGHGPYAGRAGLGRRRSTRSASPPASTSTVSGDRGTVTLPVGVADLPDGVVWTPTSRRLRRRRPGPSYDSPPKASPRMSALLAAPVLQLVLAPRTAPAPTRQGLRQRPLVGRRHQGRADLRHPGRADAVQHLVRAPRRGPHAAPHRPQRERPLRPAAVPRRRREAGAEGGHHPEGRRQGGLHPRARAVDGARRSWPSR